MDKRILKTKQRISDAFLKLIKEKPYSKITISEIAKIAEIRFIKQCSNIYFFQNFEQK